MVEFWKEEDYFFLVNPYYGALRRVCVSIGAWPYETRKEQGLRFYLTFFLLTFLLIGQIISYLAMDYTFYAFADGFLILGPTIAVASEYYSINYKQVDLVRTLLNHVRNDWCSLKTAKEFEVAHKYAEETRLYVLIFIPICFLPGVAFLLASVILVTSDFVVKRNGTHRYVFPFRLEFFLIINQEEHFFSFVFMTSILLILLATVCSANLGLMLMVVQHACGMFRIVGIRKVSHINRIHPNTLETIDDITKFLRLFFSIIDNLQDIVSVILGSAFDKKGLRYNELDEDAISATLFRAIAQHNRVIEFVETVNALCNTTYLVHIICGNILLGVDIIMMLQFDTNTEKIQRLFTTVTHTICMLSIGVSQCSIGQKLLDHSINVFQETRIMPWYVLSPRLQKLSLLVMMRSMKQCSITISKFFVPSHEMLTTGCQFASSYAMVFHSMHST